MTIERVRYFAGQVIGEADLTAEQLYFREKARRHNRMLHGWGIVCGLRVRPGPGASQVTVEPGYALDPLGDEILVEAEVTIDLCSDDERKERSAGQSLYVAISYSQLETHPVPVGESVEYSRIREGFALQILTELPSVGDRWIVLAAVWLDSQLTVSSVDCDTHAHRIAPPTSA